jgi:WD40 repeat protein
MWSPDGRVILFHVEGPAAGLEAGWHFWDIKEGKLANDPAQWKAVWAAGLGLAPDGRTALILEAGLTYVWRDLASGKVLGRLPLPYGIPALVWSPDGRFLAIQAGTGLELWRGDLRRRVRTLNTTQLLGEVTFSSDGKLVAGISLNRLHLWETDTGRLRGILVLGEKNNGLTITPDGHYTGNDQVERGIVMVVQKDDGTQELLEPADFEQKYGFKNEPNQVKHDCGM